jgi:hypothetical protein
VLQAAVEVLGRAGLDAARAGGLKEHPDRSWAAGPDQVGPDAGASWADPGYAGRSLSRRS